MMSSTIRAELLAFMLFASAAFAAEPAETPPSPQPSTEPDASSTEEAQPTNPPAARGAQPPGPQATPGRRAANDRLDLDTTIVTGNRELPKVLYIVPWKKADLGDLPGQPFNTLLDEVLTPVDRDVFRREVTYYEVISTRGGEPGAAPARGDEK